jgi:hypothetical protein
MGNLPIEDILSIIIQLSAESYSEDDWGLDSKDESCICSVALFSVIMVFISCLLCKIWLHLKLF